MSRAGTLFPPTSPQLNLDTLPADLLNKIFSFLDPETRHRFALVKSAKNSLVWNNLLQQILAQYFIKLVAWAEPATYKLEQLPPEEFKQMDSSFKPGVFYFKFDYQFLTYKVIDPQGECISNLIYFFELSSLPQGFFVNTALEAIRSIFQDILQITILRGETFTTEAEKLLMTYPQLRGILKVKSHVIDAAKNEFVNITAYQYAVWAKDTHAWRMLEKFMDHDEIIKQREEMKDPKFKRQHGSYWDSPREYNLKFVIAKQRPAPEDLVAPTLVKVQNQSAAPIFYLFGNQYTSTEMKPEFTLLDHNKFQFELISIEEKTNQSIYITSTNQYSKLYEEIDSKQAHFVNPLISAIQTYNRTEESERDDALKYQIGRAQRKIPIHMVNEYCRPDCNFGPDRNINTPILPRVSQLMDGSNWCNWFSDNKMPCCIYLQSVNDFPVLDALREEKCEIPTLFKINKNNKISYSLYGLSFERREPAISSVMLDNLYVGGVSIFTQDRYHFDNRSPLFNKLLQFEVIFSSLGLNVTITRNTCHFGALVDTEHQATNDDLPVITALCYQRTCEVLEEPQPKPSMSPKN